MGAHSSSVLPPRVLVRDTHCVVYQAQVILGDLRLIISSFFGLCRETTTSVQGVSPGRALKSDTEDSLQPYLPYALHSVFGAHVCLLNERCLNDCRLSPGVLLRIANSC